MKRDQSIYIRLHRCFIDADIGRHVYRSRWLRRKLAAHLETHHSEQYRKAWFASFPPELWAATEEEDGNGRIILRLKDGSVVPATG